MKESAAWTGGRYMTGGRKNIETLKKNGGEGGRERKWGVKKRVPAATQTNIS